jgi:hypothetical protein
MIDARITRMAKDTGHFLVRGRKSGALVTVVSNFTHLP